MKALRRFSSKLAAIPCSLIILLSLVSIGSADETYTLDNGMTVILKEQHGSPMVSSMVFVRSGSKYESRFENGITHFLEHLLFDGTVNKTQSEIDGSIRDLGGYINAFTRKELTAYLVLLPKQYIDYGMTVQADMLFNSLIPEEQLPKERKVVLEEIGRDADDPSSAAQEFYVSHAYAGTDYDDPVLGYRSFIENIPREAIVDYWKRQYVPRNMTLLVIGDFDSEEMKQTVADVFGQFENEVHLVDTTATVELAPAASERTVTPAVSPEGQQRFDTAANVTQTHINFSIAAPHHTSDDYYAMDLLSQYLGMDEVSPLMVSLTGGADPRATEASVGLTTYEEFSRLEISVLTDKPENRDEIVRIVLDQLAAISRHVADPESIEGIKTSLRAQDIYNEAKLHYYGFMISPYIFTAGWDFVQTYADRIAEVTWNDCMAAAGRWLTEPQYVATVVRPVGESGVPPYEPQGMGEAEVTAYFDTASYPAYDLRTGSELTYPATDSITFELADPATYYEDTLANGMTVIIKSTPGQRVFAMMVLGKNRSANEPEGKAGITDFVNRCIEKGTATRSARELADDLAQIGAQVTLSDNPWIPYDDRYTTRQFSFMKFETIDEYAHKGFNLFNEMLFMPAFDSSEVENVRRSMMGVLGRQSDSPRDVSRNLFYATLFEGTAYAEPIMGTPMTIGSITAEDLRDHHRKFYSPENLIVSIVTQRPVEEVLSWLDSGPGRFAAVGADLQAAQKPQPVVSVREASVPMEKEQVNIYLGGLLPGAGHADAVPISVGSSILSQRLYANLREREGLAYSVGAGSTLGPDFGWYYCAMGTAGKNYDAAVRGMLLEMEKLQLDGPLSSELDRARNHLWGRLMSAKLSAINQAYYLAVDRFLGRPLAYDQALLEGLSTVSRDDIRRVLSRHFSVNSYVVAAAGQVPVSGGE